MRVALAILALAAASAYAIYGSEIRLSDRSPTVPEISIVAIPCNRASSSPSPVNASAPAAQLDAATPGWDHSDADLEPDPSARRLAVDALAEGRVSEAAARYRELARQHPDDPALVHAARVLAREAADASRHP